MGQSAVRYYVTVGDREIEVDLSGAEPVVDGVAMRADLLPLPGGDLHQLRLNGTSLTVAAERGDPRGRWRLSVGAERIAVDVVDERSRAIREMTGASPETAEKKVVAPMPGLVLRVLVEAGQAVRAGQGVVIVEAMKMENELKAPADGIVAHVEVQAGRTVEKGAILLRFE